MVSRVPGDLTQEELLRLLNPEVAAHIVDVWMHKDLSLAIIQCQSNQERCT